jgi:RHS repeat-associated protein
LIHSCTEARGWSPYWQSWTYDQQGNRLTQTSHDLAGVTANDVTVTNIPVGGAGNTATGTAAGAPVHGLVKAASSDGAGPIAGSTITYGYDASGNTTSRTSQAGTDTLAYDTSGKLASLSTTGSTAETTNYRYDASGNLLIQADNQGSTLFVGDEEVTLAKNATAATAVRYITVAGMTVAVRDATGQVFYTIANQQGTTTMEVQASNTTSVNRRSYTPFGQDRTTSATWMGDKGFVGGQQDDSTGLTNLGAREYDPATGKFLTPDPLVVGGDPQQWNAYSYADNSPVTRSDPSGARSECGQNGDTPCGDTGNPETGGGTGKAYKGSGECTEYDRSYGRCTVEADSPSSKAQTADTEAAAEAKEAAAASAAAAAARANKEGLLHKVISLVGDLIGVNDAVNCFTKGSVVGCISTALNFVPWGKMFEAVKVGAEAYKVWHAIEHAEEAVKGAEELEHAAVAAADSSRAEAEAADAKAAASQGVSCPAAHSFTAGTQVAMADGTTKNIQDIHVGDIVMATDPQTGVSQPEPVLRLIITTTDHDFTQLTLATTGHAAHAPPASSDKNKPTVSIAVAKSKSTTTAALVTTWHHPFWNATTHQWTNASQLTPGTRLLQADSSTATVATARNYHATATTYDLTIGDLHTYYVLAGSTPILVHNCGTGRDLIGDERSDHILDGHAYPGQAGKTVFPEEWSDDDILDSVADVVTNPASSRTWATGSAKYAERTLMTKAGDPAVQNVIGSVKGVNILVRFAPLTNTVLTAFPIP